MLSLELRGSEVTACASEPVPIAPSSTLASNGWLHEAVLELVAAPSPGAYRVTLARADDGHDGGWSLHLQIIARHPRRYRGYDGEV